MQFDVFNGDADGICSLLQLRLESPVESILVTGVKRDISLLDRIDAKHGDVVTVLDISMAKNHDALVRLLNAGVSVDYFDHHYSGAIPEHSRLTHMITDAPEMCTALLVNFRLMDAQIEWAITGAFGDNLHGPAQQLAMKSGLSEEGVAYLESLGTYINYNGYGATLDDLHCHPDALYLQLYESGTPAEFKHTETFSRLSEGYAADLLASSSLKPVAEKSGFAIYQLPEKAWARRVSGVFSNKLARDYPERAHAVLTENEDGSFLVSVRAPMIRRRGALSVCKQFESGGGREAAAGINNLPAADVSRFASAMAGEYDTHS